MNENLNARVAREKKQYNDGDVFSESSKLQRRFNHVFNCANSLRSERYFSLAVAEHSRDSDVLDYGCLDGAMMPTLLDANPKSVVGIDISDVSIERAREHFGSSAQFYVADAHNTPFKDRSFDFIVGRSILHHLDWEIAINEINRILRPGGVALFTEPLGDNPAAKLIRLATPKARTKDESPLSRSQINFADKLLGQNDHLFINLISVPIAMTTSLLLQSADNTPLKLADSIDYALATTPLRFWMRSAVLVWHKAYS